LKVDKKTANILHQFLTGQKIYGVRFLGIETDGNQKHKIILGVTTLSSLALM